MQLDEKVEKKPKNWSEKSGIAGCLCLYSATLSLC